MLLHSLHTLIKSEHFFVVVVFLLAIAKVTVKHSIVVEGQKCC